MQSPRPAKTSPAPNRLAIKRAMNATQNCERQKANCRAYRFTWPSIDPRRYRICSCKSERGAMRREPILKKQFACVDEGHTPTRAGVVVSIRSRLAAWLKAAVKLPTQCGAVPPKNRPRPAYSLRRPARRQPPYSQAKHRAEAIRTMPHHEASIVSGLRRASRASSLLRALT
jgi:hypothetical protein